MSGAFWEQKTLAEMTTEEWESLCDGCGKCCVIKLEDIDTEQIHYTDVGCTLLDDETCRCRDYTRRKSIVSDCVILTPSTLDQLPWMPLTCAYRLLHEGKPLPRWHPLITGQADSTITSGNAVAGKIFREENIADDDYPYHIVDWNNATE